MKLSSFHLDSSPTLWQLPPEAVSLSSGDVHVWRASLTQPRAIVEKLRLTLSVDEQARADRFHFDVHRQHYIIGRGYLRLLLGRYLGVAAQTVRFSYQEYGKPQIANELEIAYGLKFNLAHSGNIALYAFTELGEIGIDVERINPKFASDEVARRFFSPSERLSLRELPAEIRHRAFFNCWTRKEAFLKAKGFGLSLALDEFDVTLGPEEPPMILRTRWDESDAARWELKALELEADYVAAVAVEGHNWRLRCWEFTQSS